MEQQQKTSCPFSQVMTGVYGMNAEENKQLDQIEIGAVYEHYKGKQYRIVGVFRHTEELQLYVCYEALYDCGEYGNFWARPLGMFTETVIIDGVEQPRFKKVCNTKI